MKLVNINEKKGAKTWLQKVKFQKLTSDGWFDRARADSDPKQAGCRNDGDRSDRLSDASSEESRSQSTQVDRNVGDLYDEDIPSETDYETKMLEEILEQDCQAVASGFWRLRHRSNHEEVMGHR
ncbi:hypothetical protein PsorP6_019392 [Peronosclerospora sorghi]|nr:hypothetical protein PsorP6_019393 [Peronosclerospora sorghi]KAI9895556.1 hypothetical protein PsorP6_019392 [Peronosclerospora sorghi]